jgi:hypothetical protein
MECTFYTNYYFTVMQRKCAASGVDVPAETIQALLQYSKQISFCSIQLHYLRLLFIHRPALGDSAIINTAEQAVRGALRLRTVLSMLSTIQAALAVSIGLA